MDKEFFHNECREYLDSQYGKFLVYKELLENMLDMFHGICEKHGIDYFLGGGTLLGIVRDGVPVPWDPDIDVIVSIDDIPALIEVLKKELPEEFFVESNFTDPDSDYYQIRIGHKDHPIDYFHLDVFYTIGAPEDAEQRAAFRKEIVEIYRRRMYKSALVNKKYLEDTPARAMAKKWFYRLKTRFASMKSIDRKFEKIAHRYDHKTAKYLAIFDEAAGVYPCDALEPVHPASEYGYKYLIPAKEIVYETTNYKNYKEILPIRSRFNEFFFWMYNYETLKGVKDEGYRND